MIEQTLFPQQRDLRTFAIPAVECDTNQAADAQIPAIGVAQLRMRDTLDFSIDFSAWLVANGAAQLTSATWAVASGSPKAPTIVDQAFSPMGRTTVVIKAAEGAAVGDAYWLEVTADIAATTAVNPGDVPIPARVLVRRLNIVLVQG